MLFIKGDICLSKLSDQFGKLKSDDDLENVNLHVQAVILYIIGFVVAHSSSSTVSALYLALLEDVKNIGSYAWGVTMLTHLYCSLDRIEYQNFGIYGNLHLVSMCIFEHIPWVVSQLLRPRGPNILPDFIEEVNDCPMEFPLMVECHKKMVMPLKDSMNAFNDSTFTNYFYQLSEDNVSESYGLYAPKFLLEDISGTALTQEQEDVGMVEQ
ncbi:hypothetical protein V6N13_001478 [Hibiscus sabdariffa]|uniref:Aminotransferase-like plant mobile domain-containing protein n=1 Tax=Hibiscus sabdariffa TaxID=183260 RepID=A0ABR2G9X1_9ROSI